MRPSRSSARCVTRASSPSSHAIRNWRPLMVTLTCGMAPSGLVRREHGSDRVDGGIEPLSDFTIHAFQRAAARGRGIKLRRKPRAVGAKRVQLRVKSLLAAIGLVPPLDSGGERIERKRKTLAGDVDGAPFGHPPWPLARPITVRIRQPCGGKNLSRQQAVTRRSLRCVWARSQRLTQIRRRPCECRARQGPAFFDSPGPHARASPSNTDGSAMTSPKSLFAAAASPAAQTVAVRRDDHAVAPRARHDRMANALRALAMDAVEQAKSGHPGLPMGAADVATVLFTRYLKFDATDPTWPARARVVLSAGHGSMLIYALLHLLGYERMTIEEIKRFRQLGSITPGHPESFVRPGVETTTGPLGQGLGNAVGMAIAERHLAAVFGPELVDHGTFVLASDGDLMEGVSQEAIALAGHLRLNRLIVLFDDNGISIDGPLSLADSVDQVKRFEAAGWAAMRIDGHDPDAIAAALEKAKAADRPTLIACQTTIGFGAPTKAGSEKAHGSPLGAAEIEAARKTLGWSEPAFVVPTDVRDAWRQVGLRSQPAHAAWKARMAALALDVRAELE